MWNVSEHVNLKKKHGQVDTYETVDPVSEAQRVKMYVEHGLWLKTFQVVPVVPIIYHAIIYEWMKFYIYKNINI